jgi:WD40 repeat protein
MRRIQSVLLALIFSTAAFAQGTRAWEQSRFDEFEKGTPKGVAIRSDGTLILAPAFKSLYTTPSTYIWAIASDDQAVYAAAGAPSRVYRVTADGQSSVIFAPGELQVQSIVVGSDGAIYAATSPDGKVYRIQRNSAQTSAPPAPPKANAQTTQPAVTPQAAPPAPNPQEAAAAQRVTLDPNYTSSVFFDPKTKYIWALALDRDGRLYVATGDHGEIFRVERNGTSSTFFKSDEAHIRAIAFDQKGNLIAGSDGSGLVYRIAPTGEAFVLYSAPKKEITALAIDAQGNIYAAGAGDKRQQPTLSVGATASTITTPPISLGTGQPINIQLGPQTINPPTGPFPVPGMGASGSEVYRIAPDGSPRRIWSSRDDLVYSLAFDQSGTLLAGTGNKGRVYAIQGPGQFTDLLKASASQVVGFARAPKGGLYIATSNLGKIFLLQEADEREGTYESDVYDARIFSRWGRAELRSHGNVELWARSGNVDNPDRNWSPFRRIDLQKDPILDVPPARFVQWRSVLHSGNPAPSVDSVRINYLSKNVAPEVDDVNVQVGYKFQQTPRTGPQPVSTDVSQQQPRFEAPAVPVRDTDSIAVRWIARDENEDQLTFSLYYRGDNETRWKLLKSDLADKFFSFDAGLLPDGGYSVRVVTSDAASHSPDEALTASRESPRFEVDNTPPAVQNLQAVLENGEIHVTFSAADSFSTIRQAEFSVDAGDWQYVAPVGEISDARQESYDFTAPAPAVKPDPTEANAATAAVPATPADQVSTKDKRKRRPQPAAPIINLPAGPEEHVVVIRVYDRFENMGSAKVVVRSR